jgi:aconitate hydratase
VDWVYDIAMRYKSENVPLIVIAGKDYGAGSCRDWAAKGPWLLGMSVSGRSLPLPFSDLCK